MGCVQLVPDYHIYKYLCVSANSIFNDCLDKVVNYETIHNSYVVASGTDRAHLQLSSDLLQIGDYQPRISEFEAK